MSSNVQPATPSPSEPGSRASQSTLENSLVPESVRKSVVTDLELDDNGTSRLNQYVFTRYLGKGAYGTVQYGDAFLLDVFIFTFAYLLG
jgi:hypothetical protein